MYKRRGGLFMRPFKRKLIDNETYRRNAVVYIHRNPIESGLAKDLASWSYSSYQQISTNQPTFILRDETISWFDDNENFIFCHSDNPDSDFED